MENESLSAQIVTLKLINTKFKARIAELEARLKESEADRLLDAELVKRIDADGFAVALRERAEKGEADVGRLRSAIEKVEWGWVSLGSKTYHEVCAWCRGFKQHGHKPDCARQAALSPAEQADDEKGVKG